MKALSIRQPWAWLICKGYKDIENRTWWIHMPPLLNYPATPRRIYVHTGKTIDESAGEFIAERLDRFQSIELANAIRNGLANGAIIGEVDITGCVEKSDSPWFEGPYGFVLANPFLYPHPISYKGRLGFFDVDLEKI